MGSNTEGKLGIGNKNLKESLVPQLVDFLMNVKISKISCGDNHTIALTNGGEVFAWG